MMTHRDLNASQKDVLANLYANASCTSTDDLPYTDEFDRIYDQFLAQTGVALDRHHFWKALSNARKARKLVRKERKAATLSTQIKVSTAVQQQKAQRVVKAKMRALSVRQPFAEQIMTGEKQIEYRTQRTHIRGRVYIYACKTPGDAESYTEAGYDVDDLPSGVLVGSVDLVDCTGQDGDFEWHLANPKRLRMRLAVEGMPQPGFFWPFGQ